MSETSNAPAGSNLQDFFSHFHSQTVNSLGSLADSNHRTVPTNENIPLEEYIESAKKANHEGATQSPQAPPTRVYSEPTMTKPAVAQSTQVYSDDFLTRGEVPPNLRPAECCGGCIHFNQCSSYCYKHDFRCGVNYTCDDFVKESSLAGEFYDAGKETYSFDFDVTKAGDQHIQLYTESLQNGLAQELKHKNLLQTSRSNLYVFSKASAEAAYVFKPYLEEKAAIALSIIGRRYGIEEAYNEDDPLQSLAPNQPTNAALYQFAQIVSQPGLILETYEELYKDKYGSVEGAYSEPPIEQSAAPEAPEVETSTKSEVQTLAGGVITADLGGAAVTQATYVGDVQADETLYSKLTQEDPLYAVAEKRVKFTAQKESRDYTPEEIIKELKRMKLARQQVTKDD